MAQKIPASMPDGLDLDSNYSVLFTAIDAATGDPVPAVLVSNASLIVAQVGGGDPGDLAYGPFAPVFVPVNFDPPAAAASSPASG